MHRELFTVLAAAAICACGGATFNGPTDGGADGGSSSSSGSSSGASSSGSGSSSGASSGSSSGNTSSGSSGGSSSGSGSGGSSGGSSSGSSSGGSSSGSSSGADGGRIPLNHRPDDSQCLTTAPAGDCNSGGGGPGMCSSDGQCADGGAGGRCIESNGGALYCYCTYDSCADDAACAKGQTCACHGSPYTYGRGNTCVPGNCRVDADCGSGGWCSPSYDTTSCGSLAGYYCHTAGDRCIDDTDCATNSVPQMCAYDSGLGYWECKQYGLCG